MDAETAVLAILPPPSLERFRRVCEVEGPLDPRFNGYSKLVLLTADRAFLFPRNHTIVAQLERECAVYSTLDHPFVPRLLGRWEHPGISPYPFFAVTRLAGHAAASLSPERLPALAAALGAALAACHEISLDATPRSLWANPWSEPPPAPPTAGAVPGRRGTAGGHRGALHRNRPLAAAAPHVCRSRLRGSRRGGVSFPAWRRA